MPAALCDQHPLRHARRGVGSRRPVVSQRSLLRRRRRMAQDVLDRALSIPADRIDAFCYIERGAELDALSVLARDAPMAESLAVQLLALEDTIRDHFWKADDTAPDDFDCAAIDALRAVCAADTLTAEQFRRLICGFDRVARMNLAAVRGQLLADTPAPAASAGAAG